MKHADAHAVLTEKIARARRAIWIERLLAAAFPAGVVLALWLALHLFGLIARLPGLAASALGVLALALVAGLGVWGRVRLRAPTAQDARKRLVEDAKLEPGALDALEDSPSQLDPFALALWRRAQERAGALAASVRVRAPRLHWRRLDPWFFRVLGPTALIGGLVVAGPEAPQRLAAALLPDPGPLLGDKPLAIEAWVAPAAYTGAAPIAISERIGETIPTPPALDVVVRVSGPVGAPVLRYVRAGRDLRVRLAPTPDGAWEGRLSVSQPGLLQLVRFQEKARWRLRPAADAAPSARFAQLPEQDDETLSFGWAASDDFGVANAVLRLEPVAPLPGLAGAAPRDVPLSGFSAQAQEAEAEAELNLVDHPYAGLAVTARIVAVDGAGQEGASEPVSLTLPERIFLQPLAKAAIEIRREVLLEQRPYAPAPRGLARVSVVLPGPGLAAERVFLHTDDVDPRLERAPQPIRDAAHKLDALTIHPLDGYFRDLAVFSGFKAARALIAVAANTSELEAPAQVLWDVAMRAEYGDSADARRALEAAQQALADALRRGADPQEIARLTQKLREATRNYLQALRQEALRQNRTAESQESDGQQTANLTRDDIEQLLNRVEELSQQGRHEEAAALLERIAALLENLQVQLANGPGGEGEPGGERGDPKLRESIDDLSGAIGQQRSLNDETERLQEGQTGQQEERGQEGQNGEQGPTERRQNGQAGGQDGDQGQGQAAGGPPRGQEGAGDTPARLAERQAQLRRGLDAARRSLPSDQGEARRRLDRAGEAMGLAEDALRRGNLPEARRQQDAALAALRAGADELARSLDRQRNESDETQQRDPLGRPIGGVGDGDETQVPGESERQRSREILDELRRRAADPNRPQVERDYLRRLLDQFDEGS